MGKIQGAIVRFAEFDEQVVGEVVRSLFSHTSISSSDNDFRKIGNHSIFEQLKANWRKGMFVCSVVSTQKFQQV